MKAIVFGSSGFIGGHVVEQLYLAGHQVTAVVRDSSNTNFLKSLGVYLIKVDFSNLEEIGKAIEGHEVVYNCTAEEQPDLQQELHENKELKLTKILIEAAALHGASRFIHLSTIVVYDFRTGESIDELYQTQPEYPIQILKLEKDKIVQESGIKLGISTFVLRPASTIGPRDRKSFFARLFTAHMNDQYPMAGNGDTKVSLVDTRDIGRAMVFLGTLSKQDHENGIYLLKGFDTTWHQLKEEIDLAIGRIAKTVELPPNDSSFAGKTLSINRIWNDTKIKNAGFNPLYSLRNSVRTSVKDLLNDSNREVEQ